MAYLNDRGLVDATVLSSASFGNPHSSKSTLRLMQPNLLFLPLIPTHFIVYCSLAQSRIRPHYLDSRIRGNDSFFLKEHQVRQVTLPSLLFMNDMKMMSCCNLRAHKIGRGSALSATTTYIPCCTQRVFQEVQGGATCEEVATP